MSEEISRGLGVEGGGFPAVTYEYEWCPDCKGAGFVEQKLHDGTPKPEHLCPPCPTCKGSAQVRKPETEKTYTLSDCPLALQAELSCWMKATLRREKLNQFEDGICDAAELERFNFKLDQDFAFGAYTFGKGPKWSEIIETRDGAAKLHQLLLKQHHPETQTWTFEQIRNLVDPNARSFQLALGDIIPKAMAKLGQKVNPYRLSRLLAS